MSWRIFKAFYHKLEEFNYIANLNNGQITTHMVVHIKFYFRKADSFVCHPFQNFTFDLFITGKRWRYYNFNIKLQEFDRLNIKI